MSSKPSNEVGAESATAAENEVSNESATAAENKVSNESATAAENKVSNESATAAENEVSNESATAAENKVSNESATAAENKVSNESVTAGKNDVLPDNSGTRAEPEIAQPVSEGSSVRHRKMPTLGPLAARDDDSGDETPDTDQEDEEHRLRKVEAKKKGTRLVHRASFKRDRTDRHYDKYGLFAELFVKVMTILKLIYLL